MQATFNGLDGFMLPPRNKPTQGTQANLSGQTVEDTIYYMMRERGYTVQRQYPVGLSIYGHNLNVDFYVTGIDLFPEGLIIESRWQEAHGSADEKFPYMVGNIKECYPYPTIVVYGGGGARVGAIQWLRNMVGGNLYAAFSLEEFLAWTIRVLR